MLTKVHVLFLNAFLVLRIFMFIITYILLYIFAIYVCVYKFGRTNKPRDRSYFWNYNRANLPFYERNSHVSDQLLSMNNF